MDHQPSVDIVECSTENARPIVPAGFAEGVWHPEDLVRLTGTPWVVVSAMRSVRGRGALLALKTDAQAPAEEIEWMFNAETGRVSPSVFDPHGIDVRRIGDHRFELLVVDHGGGEAIDRLILETSGGKPRVITGTRIEQPVGTSGNAVALLPDGGFAMTSMFDPRAPDTLERFASSRVTGSVWTWRPAQGWQRVGPPLSGANGIAVSPDGDTIIVSEWSAQRVWKLSLASDMMTHINVDFLPDNLRWNDDGTLLLAGQIARPERVFGCESRGEACPLAFAVATLEPNAMRLNTLLRVSHERAVAMGFGGATGALRVEEEIWVASFTGERLARYWIDKQR